MARASPSGGVWFGVLLLKHVTRERCMTMKKKASSAAQKRWKTERSDERWERRADRLMIVFSHVSVMLPSQISHLKEKAKESA
jgi:hypothetical protein